jgi:hypothetical protein
MTLDKRCYNWEDEQLLTRKQIMREYDISEQMVDDYISSFEKEEGN